MDKILEIISKYVEKAKINTKHRIYGILFKERGRYLQGKISKLILGKGTISVRSNTIRILCPQCGKGRLLDAVSNASAAKVQLYGPRHLDKAEWIAKCPKCGNQIGIAIVKTKYEQQRTGT